VAPVHAAVVLLVHAVVVDRRHDHLVHAVVHPRVFERPLGAQPLVPGSPRRAPVGRLEDAPPLDDGPEAVAVVRVGEEAGDAEMPGRLVLGHVPLRPPRLAVERREQRPGRAAVVALEQAGGLGAGDDAAVRRHQAGHLGEPQLPVLAVAETLARELPRLPQVGAAPDAGAMPLAGGGGVDRARLRVVDRVVDRPAVAERPAHLPVAAGLVALEDEAALACPHEQHHSPGHQHTSRSGFSYVRHGPARKLIGGRLLLGRRRDLELPLRDLVERHRQEVLRARLDERRREALEAALAELVVVVVDLARAPRGGDHERVLAVHLLQQVVDLGMDHACSSAFIADRISSARSAAARSTSSLMIVWSNSGLALISSAAIRSRSATSVSVFCRRPRSLASRSSIVGGATNTSTAPGICRLISRAPATSISSTTLPPSRSRCSTSLRSVPYRFPAYDTCSRNSPSSTRRANSAAVRKWYSRPSCSSGRRGRVVADVATSSWGSAARARAMRVPLPTP